MGQTQSINDEDERKTTVPCAPSTAALSSTFALGAGCYWGTEKFIIKDFQKRYPDSILKARVGFMSPNLNNHVKNITYEEVCHASNSDFVEVLHITLRNPHQHFEELIKFFFSFHDPTTMNQQGNDLGLQYGSYIFYQDEEQANIAKRVRLQLKDHIQNGRIKSFQRRTVTTKILPVNIFIKAKRDHQQYLMKNPRGYCNHFIRFKKWPKDQSILVDY